MTQLASYNLMEDRTRECPFPYFKAIRREAPVYFMPELGAWYVSRYEDLRYVKKHPELFSNNIYEYGARQGTSRDIAESYRSEHGWHRVHTLQRTDPPEHTRYRKLINHAFSVKRIRGMTAYVETIVNDLVDGFIHRGECDFVTDVAARLPLRIVCDLMGIPSSHHDFVFDQSNIILGAADEEYVPEFDDLLTAILTAGERLSQLMDDVAESKVGVESEDLTSVLVNAEVDGERLTRAELASFFILLVVAGNETTRNAISWGLVYLTDNPEQRRIWAEDFEGVAHSAVEEIVRIASPVTYMRRTALCDTELEGVKIDEGDQVVMHYLCANRDETVFDDPLTFDVLRDPNSHVGYGGPGPHYCLGAHLARREIKVMFRELFTRIGDIEATGEPELLSSAFIHGIKHLPAKFTPTGPRSTQH